MNGKKIITVLIIINILLIGVIYNFLNRNYLNNDKIILKAMSQTEYESQIDSLNETYQNYQKYIADSKTQLASAITDMGVETSNLDSLETIASNIKNIARDAASISYDNTASGLTSTNVQGAVDELDDEVDELNNSFIGWPDMTNQIYALSSWQTEFSWTATEDCWIYAMLNTNKSYVSAYVKLNGALVTQILGTNTEHSVQMGALFPCKKGDVISKETHGNTQARFVVYGIRY